MKDKVLFYIIFILLIVSLSAGVAYAIVYYREDTNTGSRVLEWAEAQISDDGTTGYAEGQVERLSNGYGIEIEIFGYRSRFSPPNYFYHYEYYSPSKNLASLYAGESKPSGIDTWVETRVIGYYLDNIGNHTDGQADVRVTDNGIVFT